MAGLSVASAARWSKYLKPTRRQMTPAVGRSDRPGSQREQLGEGGDGMIGNGEETDREERERRKRKDVYTKSK